MPLRADVEGELMVFEKMAAGEEIPELARDLGINLATIIVLTP